MASGRPPAPGARARFPARGLRTLTRGVCTCGALARACADGYLPRSTKILSVAFGCVG